MVLDLVIIGLAITLEPLTIVAFLLILGAQQDELWIMRAQTAADFVASLRWAQLALFFMFVSITWFVRSYLNAGRPWLAWTITGLRTVYLMLTFVAGLNVNYLTVSSPRHIQFLGESIAVLGGVPNPLMAFGQFGVLLILVFTVDASVTAWRRGDRRKAVTVGGSVDFFILAGLATVSVVIWGNVQAPIVISPCYLGLVLVMGYELSRDVLRASQLVHDLQASEAGLRESEARMSLAVEAGDFGIWIWDLARNEIWASDSWRALFGIAPAEPLTVDGVMRRVHPGRSRRAEADASLRDRRLERRPLRDGVPGADAGWHDPLDLVPRLGSRSTPAGRSRYAAPHARSPRASRPSRRRCCCGRRSPTPDASR